jgi:hypothetical protein
MRSRDIISEATRADSRPTRGLEPGGLYDWPL